MTFSRDKNMFFRVAPEMPGRISGTTKTSVYVFVSAVQKSRFSQDNNMNLCFCRACFQPRQKHYPINP